MGTGSVVTILTNIVLCVCALPIILVGMWLSVRSWRYYLVILIGLAWVTYIISNQIYSTIQVLNAGRTLTIILWLAPVAFFTCLNVGAIQGIKAMREKRK